MHWCKAWHLWIGIFNGYLNDYFGRPPWKFDSNLMLKKSFCSPARKIRITRTADFGRFWPTCASVSVMAFFSPVLAFSWNLEGIIGEHFRQKLWPITPKFGLKCDHFEPKKIDRVDNGGQGRSKYGPKLPLYCPLLLPILTFPDPPCRPGQIFLVQNGVYMCPAYSTTCFKFNQHLRGVF